MIYKGKMSFITEWDIYCYKVKSFALKNTGATYQCLIKKMFANHQKKTIKVYRWYISQIERVKSTFFIPKRDIWYCKLIWGEA